MTDRETGLSFSEVLDYPWLDQYLYGVISLDWIMYNPNYDIYIYSIVQFHFSPNGFFNFISVTDCFKGPNSSATWILLLLVFFLLFTYYCLHLLRELVRQWQ